MNQQYIEAISETFFRFEQMDVCTRESLTMLDRPGKMAASTPVNVWTCRLADTDARTGAKI